MRVEMRIIAFIIFAVIMAVGVYGYCETYGEVISNHGVNTIKDILCNTRSYEGKTVTLKGRIAIECPSGCWFNIKEDGAMLRVDLKPAGIAIPQKVGSKVTVEGTICIVGGSPVLYGKGVQI